MAPEMKDGKREQNPSSLQDVHELVLGGNRLFAVHSVLRSQRGVPENLCTLNDFVLHATTAEVEVTEPTELTYARSYKCLRPCRNRRS